MPLNKKRLKDAKLYLILDAEVLDYDGLLRVLKESVRFGIDIVQLRNKFGTAKDILTFSRQALKITRHKVPFIINDRLDLAILAKADGVHLGQDDVSYADARRLMGKKAIIGVSCQNLADARQAQRQGVDYIGFGSIFKTKTKPERNPMDLNKLQTVLTKIKVPVFPIGGISKANIHQLTARGVNRAAVCRDILLAQNPGQVVKELKQLLKD
jgi:thiamine-phosphate pyrophosphorylase